jgi:hypothetical protein
VTIVEAVRSPLAAATSVLGIGDHARIGFEGGAAFDPSGYAWAYVYGAAVEHLLRDVFVGADLRDATDCLADVQSVLTQRELGHLRTACAVAQPAYENTAAGNSGRDHRVGHRGAPQRRACRGQARPVRWVRVLHVWSELSASVRRLSMVGFPCDRGRRFRVAPLQLVLRRVLDGH